MAPVSKRKTQALDVGHLRQLLSYDPNTGEFKWRTDPVAGYVQGAGYRRIKIGQELYYAHRLAWFYVHGEWPKGEVDHINRERDDNRLANLRDVTGSQNQANRGRGKNNRSGYKGVCFMNGIGKWRASIKYGSRRIFLGNFVTPEEANAAYKAAALRYYSGFAAFQ